MGIASPTESPGVLFFVALVVGTILNLINQGDTLFGDGRVDLTKVILTYAVPTPFEIQARSLAPLPPEKI
jgi:hypothetical protein